MTQISPTISPAVSPVPGVRGLWRMYMELGKARLSGLVVATTAVGYLVAARGRVDLWTLLWTVVGTSLAAVCANTLNQVIEIERDGKMQRTSGRPLPSGRIGLAHAAGMGVLAGGAGLTILAAMTNALTVGLGALTIALYLLVYTPLKTRSTLNTLAGAVVGAIPPVLGWTAATGRIEAGALALGAILFVWQIPHFMALAWMYREDYARGGYRMLPVADPTGVVTCRTVLMWSAALIPVALMACLTGVSGWVYAASAIGLGGWLLALAVRMQRDPSNTAARKLFLATVMYLPLLMVVMVLDSPREGSEFEGRGSARTAVNLSVSAP